MPVDRGSRHLKDFVSSFGGVISERIAELGEWINPGAGLFELVATDDLRIDFRVGQDLFGALSADAEIEIALDAVPDRSLTGRIDTIVPVKNPGARTFLVRVLADSLESDGALAITPGMSARGRLSIDTGRDGVVAPRDALLRYPDGRITVWRVATEGEVRVVHEQSVRTGFEFDGLTEIVSGLADGDIVVVRGNETLLEGQGVSILDRNR